MYKYQTSILLSSFCLRDRLTQIHNVETTCIPTHYQTCTCSKFLSCSYEINLESEQETVLNLETSTHANLVIVIDRPIRGIVRTAFKTQIFALIAPSKHDNRIHDYDGYCSSAALLLDYLTFQVLQSCRLPALNFFLQYLKYRNLRVA